MNPKTSKQLSFEEWHKKEAPKFNEALALGVMKLILPSGVFNNAYQNGTFEFDKKNKYIEEVDKWLMPYKPNVDNFIEDIAPVLLEIKNNIISFLNKISISIYIWLKENLNTYTLNNKNFYIINKDLKNFLVLSDCNNEKTLLSRIEQYCTENNYKNLQKILKDLSNSEFTKKRKNIFNTCITILNNNLIKEQDKCNAIIPLLLSQADGIAKDFYIYTNPQKYKQQRVIKHANAITQDLSLKYTNNEMSYFIQIIRYLFHYDKPLKDSFGNIVFNSADKNEQAKWVLDRNAIMHGQKLDYGEILEMIRLILFLDTMVQSINKIIKNNEE